MNQIIIIAKKEFHKSYKELEKLFIGKHYDYAQLTILVRKLQELKIDYNYLSWSEFEKEKFLECTLLVIPQERFLSGSTPTSNQVWQKLTELRKTGVNFLFLHHPASEFIKNRFIDVEEINYFNSRVDKYLIHDHPSSKLLVNIQNVIDSGNRASDEFTYFPKRKSEFITLIEKIPRIQKAGLNKKYICFGYQEYTPKSKVYFVDIHSVGSKLGFNSFLFEQIINNIINTIFNLDVSEDEIELKILKSNLPETEKKALIDSRRGQGKFRQLLINYWKNCSVTGCKNLEFLKASHIKPWRSSNNRERLDPFNGILLLPNLDLLFDKGYITFDSDGNINLSKRISEQECQLLGINIRMKIKLHKKHNEYLEYHRKKIFA